MLDHSKSLLFVGLMLFAVLLVTSNARVTETTPIDGSEPVDDASQTAADQSNLAPSWAANVPSMPHPLALMMPNTGTQPAGDA